MHRSTPFTLVVSSASARLHLIQSAPASTASPKSAPRLSTKTDTPLFCKSPINFFHQPLGQPVAELPATTHQSSFRKTCLQYFPILAQPAKLISGSIVKKSILSSPFLTKAHPTLSLGSDPTSDPQTKASKMVFEIAGTPHARS